jgi:hypothetical protein
MLIESAVSGHGVDYKHFSNVNIENILNEYFSIQFKSFCLFCSRNLYLAIQPPGIEQLNN